MYRNLMNGGSHQVFHAPDGAGGGSWSFLRKTPAKSAEGQAVTPPNTTSGNGNSSTTTGNTNGNNNTISDDEFVDSIWKRAVDPNATTKAPDPNAGNTQSGNQEQPTREERVARYLKEQGLDPITLNDEQIQGLQNGSFGIKDLLPALNEKIANAHLKAIQNSKALVDDAVNRAVEQAVAKATGSYQADQMRQELREKVPLAADPLVAPLAESVFKQFMEKPGATREQAIRATKLYFEKVAEKVAGGPINTNSRMANMPSGPAGGEDWVDILSPKAA